jgi:hypothetical protein
MHFHALTGIFSRYLEGRPEAATIGKVPEEARKIMREDVLARANSLADGPRR